MAELFQRAARHQCSAFIPFFSSFTVLHHEVKTTFLSTKRFFSPIFVPILFHFNFFSGPKFCSSFSHVFFISYFGILVNFLLVSHTVCFIFTMRALHTFKTIRNGKCKFFLFHRIFFSPKKKMHEMNEAKTNILKHNTIYDIYFVGELVWKMFTGLFFALLLFLLYNRTLKPLVCMLSVCSDSRNGKSCFLH